MTIILDRGKINKTLRGSPRVIKDPRMSNVYEDWSVLSAEDVGGVKYGSALFQAAASLSATARYEFGRATLTGTATLTASGRRVQFDSGGTLGGTASLVAHSCAVRRGVVSISGAATFLPVTLGGRFGTASVVGVAALASAGVSLGTSVVLLSATATLTAAGGISGASFAGSAALAGSASVFVLARDFATGAFKFLIAGVTRTAWAARGTLYTEDALNERNVCSVTLNIATTEEDKPQVGDRIEVYNGATVVFSGTLEHVSYHMEGHSGILRYRCSAVDYHQICDRKLLAKTYENQAVGDIVRDIVDTEVRAEGIFDLGVVAAGPTVTKAVFSYQTVTEALNELAELVGYFWYVDYGRVLHFIDKETFTSPFSIVEGVNAHVRDFTVTETRENYRNVQFVKAQKARTDPRTEIFEGDWVSRTFTLALPVAEAPSLVLVNDTPALVGRAGNPDDMDAEWFWSPEENVLSQNEDSQLYPTLTTLDNLTVIYRGCYPRIVERTDDAEIASRQGVEGGTGRYEALFTDQRLNEVGQAEEYGDALLRRLGAPPVTVEFSTDLNGLAAGQTLTVTMPSYGIDGSYLITSVVAEDVHALFLRFRVKAVSTERMSSWTDFYRRLVGTEARLGGEEFIMPDTTGAMTSLELADGVTLSDELALTLGESNPAYVGSTYYDEGEIS